MSYTSNDLLAKILDKLNKQEDLLNTLKSRMDTIENLPTVDKNNRNLIELDDYSKYLPSETIIKYMEMQSVKGDIKLFKLIYLDKKDHIPIKFNGKNKFEYIGVNNKWKTDNYGIKIRNIFLKNLRNVYYRYNTMDRYRNNSEMFISNQIHITKMLESKYQSKWLNELKQYLV